MKKIKFVMDLPRFQRYMELFQKHTEEITLQDKEFIRETNQKSFAEWLEEWNREVEKHNQENNDAN